MQGLISFIPCSPMCQGEMGAKDQIYLIRVISLLVVHALEVGSWLMMATELVPQTSNLDSTFPVDSVKQGAAAFSM